MVRVSTLYHSTEHSTQHTQQPSRVAAAVYSPSACCRYTAASDVTQLTSLLIMASPAPPREFLDISSLLLRPQAQINGLQTPGGMLALTFPLPRLADRPSGNLHLKFHLRVAESHKLVVSFFFSLYIVLPPARQTDRLIGE